jgi:uncharacterized membrane protein YvlD (DUF360 family)
MSFRHLYLGLFVLGSAVPCLWLAPWLSDHGLDLPLMLRELAGNRVGGFFGLDVALAAVTLIAFIVREARTLGIRHAWTAIMATCLVGVSSGLPLFLYLRQRRIDHAPLRRAMST